MELINRFLSKIKKTKSCWKWKACKTKKGYGKFATKPGRWELAHRVSYEIFKKKLNKNELVLHTCDNTSCVNPKHLYAGTQKQNMADAKSRGRTYIKSHCINGHPKTEANTRLYINKKGWMFRACKICIKKRRKFGTLAGY